MSADHEYSPDPRKINIRGGVIFNPWINISVCLIITAAFAWLTVWAWGEWMDARNAPAYEDQGLDIVGMFIGGTVFGVVAIIMVAVTIWVVIWSAKRSKPKK